MATGTSKNSPRASEICPACNQKVTFKEIGESLLPFDLDGTVHRCWPSESKPIGISVQGKTILNFSLKKRRVTLVLSDDTTLEIYAGTEDELVPMNLRLLAPSGIVEERK